MKIAYPTIVRQAACRASPKTPSERVRNLQQGFEKGVSSQKSERTTLKLVSTWVPLAFKERVKKF